MRRYMLLTTLFLWEQALVCSVRILELRVPAHTAEGGEALLGCQFDMEGDVLYSVKWYKDGREFYRYVPGGPRPISHFATPGVIVDIDRSSNTVVTLIHLSRDSSGIYRCEVSGEAPHFATVYDEKYITVYLLPENGPHITGVQEKYNVGDRVAANCTSPGSRPEAQLMWLINNRPVPKSFLRGPWYRTSIRPDATETILQLAFNAAPIYFKKGVMDLKCQSTIAPLYHQEKVHRAIRYEIPTDLSTKGPEITEEKTPTFQGFGETTHIQFDFDDLRTDSIDDKDNAAETRHVMLHSLLTLVILRIMI